MTELSDSLPGRKRPARSLTKRSSLLALGLIFVFHVVNNLYWLSTNVVTIGWDRNDHLVRTLSYNNILAQITPATLFKALTWSDYYPPLVHLVVVAAYKLLGVSTDVAAMTNLVYLAFLLGAVFMIGQELRGEMTGLLAALLVSLFPMVFAFSRYLYLDFALTSMVAANLALLLRTDRFRRRQLARLYGLSLGLGMLTKWTFVAFVTAPLLWIVWRRGVWRELLRVLRSLPTHRRMLSLSLAGGTILSAIWLLPNGSRVQELALGWALVPLFAFLFAATAFFLTRPNDPGWNALGAGALGLSISGLWYFTKINFFPLTLLTAYGKSTGRVWGFGRYLRYLWTEELSPIFVFFFVIALLLLAKRVITHPERVRKAWLGRDDVWVIPLWLIVPYVVFSWHVSTVHARYILPLLPAIGLIIAAGVEMISPSGVRRAATAFIVIVALIQYAVLTFDGLEPLRQAAWAHLSYGGRSVSWFANDFQNQLPDSGSTDHRYWIVPDVLRRVEAGRKKRGMAQAELAILINDAQVHEKHFLYQIYVDFPRIRLRELARNWSGRPAYPQLFDTDFVLLGDQPRPHEVARESQQTIRRILNTPTDLFHYVFRLDHRYILPSGENVYLYERILPPPSVNIQYYQALLQDLTNLWQEGDALLISPQEDIALFGQLGATGFNPQPLPQGKDEESSLSLLEALAAQHRRVILVQRDGTAKVSEDWLSRRHFRAFDAWYGNLLLTIYATGVEHPPAPVPVTARFGSHIYLTGYSLGQEEAYPGGTLCLSLYWHTDRPISQRLKVFVHLVDERGQLVAQRDSEPLGGTMLMPTWKPGQTVTDKVGIILPHTLTSRVLKVVIGLYDPVTGQRWPVHPLAGEPSDHLTLTDLAIDGETP